MIQFMMQCLLAINEFVLQDIHSNIYGFGDDIIILWQNSHDMVTLQTRQYRLYMYIFMKSYELPVESKYDVTNCTIKY